MPRADLLPVPLVPQQQAGLLRDETDGHLEFESVSILWADSVCRMSKGHVCRQGIRMWYIFIQLLSIESMNLSMLLFT